MSEGGHFFFFMLIDDHPLFLYSFEERSFPFLYGAFQTLRRREMRTFRLPFLPQVAVMTALLCSGFVGPRFLPLDAARVPHSGR